MSEHMFGSGMVATQMAGYNPELAVELVGCAPTYETGYYPVDPPKPVRQVVVESVMRPVEGYRSGRALLTADRIAKKALKQLAPYYEQGNEFGKKQSNDDSSLE